MKAKLLVLALILAIVAGCAGSKDRTLKWVPVENDAVSCMFLAADTSIYERKDSLGKVSRSRDPKVYWVKGYQVGEQNVGVDKKPFNKGVVIFLTKED